MRSSIKYALVVAALTAWSSAHAIVVNGASGNGQMVLFVKNQTTGAVYARGLNLFVNDFITEEQIVGDVYAGSTAAPDTSISYELPAPIGPDATLTGFLNGTDEFQWTVIAGDSQGLTALGTKRYVVTQQAAPTPTNLNIVANWVQANGVWDALNSYLTGPDNSTGVNGQWDGPSGIGSQLDIWFAPGGSSISNNRNPLDTAANLYVATTSSAVAGQPARRYLLGQLILTADGTLESVGPPPVIAPLPAAAWLLGSALVGVAGVGRRRRDDAARGSAAPA